MFETLCVKCKTDVTPVLDVKANVVVCPDCEEELTQITNFVKVQLKAAGQIKKEKQSRKAFSVRCQVCNKEAQPKIANGKVLCSLCGNEHEHLSAPFKQAILTAMK